MSMEQTYPSAVGLAQELGLLPSEVLESAAIRLVFNHFAKQQYRGSALTRMERAFEHSIEHVNMRLSLMNGYEPAFFSPNYEINKDALTIAVLCSPLLTENTKVADLDVHGLPERITDETIKQALQIQKDAARIKEYADMDYKGLRADNDAYSREAYFLAYINLLEKMNRVENSYVDYDGLSEHLRYDIIFAPVYVEQNTTFGRILTRTIDEMETKIVDQLRACYKVKVVAPIKPQPDPSFH